MGGTVIVACFDFHGFYDYALNGIDLTLSMLSLDALSQRSNVDPPYDTIFSLRLFASSALVDGGCTRDYNGSWHVLKRRSR